MKLIIDIPDEEYNECIERNEWDTLSLGVKLIQAVQNGASLLKELENAKREIEEIKTKKPLMSKGFECYGFKDKTPEDIKTEIIEMLDNRIEELKEGAE